MSTSFDQQTLADYRTTDLLSEKRYDEKEKNTFYVIIMALLASMGGFIYGYDTGEISGLVAMPDFLRRFAQLQPDGTYTFSHVREGTIVGLLSVGTLVGCIVAGRLAETKIGRRGSIVVACLIFDIGTVIQIASTTHWVQVAIGRLVAGVGVGIISVCVPLYQSESAPKNIRGTLVSTYQLFITFGILVAYLINYGTKRIDSAASWRITVGIGFVWANFLAVGISFMPESPRYSLKRGKEEQARKDLMKIRGVPADNHNLNIDIAEMKNAFAMDESLPHGWLELVRGEPKVFYRVALGTMLQIFQQLTGANYFFYYGTTVFNSVGIKDSYITSIILGAVNFGCTFGGLYIVEKFGRRRCLIAGSFWMFACFMVFASMGTYVTTGVAYTPTETSGYVMIIFACLFILGFSVTWAPIIWVHNGEIFPSRIRAKAIGVATCGNWSFNFLISFFTPFITGNIGFKYGYVFAACCFTSGVFVYFFVYETKGLTLEQIDQMYGSPTCKPWTSSRWEPSDQVVVSRKSPNAVNQWKEPEALGSSAHVDNVSRNQHSTEQGGVSMV